MIKHAKRDTKYSNDPGAQNVTNVKVMPPSMMPPEQMVNVKMQLIVNINTNMGPATNIWTQW